MEKKKNSYEREATRKSLLDGITKDLETKGDVKNSAIETVKDLVVGVLGGGLVGAAIGRASLAIGTLVTGIGHYTKSRLTSIFGIGMMASGGFQQPQSVEGTEKKEVMEGVKERVAAFKNGLTHKLFIGKLLKSKKQEEKTEESMGEVQYFVPPAQQELSEAPNKEIDLSVLDELEKQIANSGAEYEKKKELKGMLPKEEVGALDPNEKNF